MEGRKEGRKEKKEGKEGKKEGGKEGGKGRLIPTKADFCHIIESGGGGGSTVEMKNH